MFRDAHFAVFTVELEGEDGAVLQTEVTGLVCHRVDLAAMTKLVEYAILAGHEGVGRLRL